MSNINNIAVLTSGGDSPGMNAGIRAVIRTGIYHGKNMFGIRRGYDGMVQGDITPMDAKSVANIIQRGGTILKTARSDEFRTVEGRKQAYENLKKHNIDALVVIGGDGTFTGASKFIEEFDMPIIGMPGTIDNDLNGTDFTIGYDTAINTVVEAVDKIRDTAESHDRLFVVEVMGRDSGLIALRSGISTGAEAVLIPELEVDYDAIMKRLDKTRKNKSSRIIIVAEGDKEGGMVVAEKIQANFPAYDVRLSILGHIQRGGSPTCMDRVLASRLGVAAVEGLLEGRKAEMAGLICGNVQFTPFNKAIKHIDKVNENLTRIVEILSL
ncbi:MULTISPECIES: 6-phosphofructokinase [Sphingobacterium]|mgnify:FL=1|uniref:ATP-dependent 6-phosphofructokinase n=1 Tax=Sphingobacterium cellulitidis TaxID=1768011 RepID=A0A8H9KT45_9SPHI|nr:MULTISPECIES: 6-phosphofructokinase [Sphingobacterium]MBA8985358.1 6-phosphofructokinase 1 [Sphingobacterium soli]OYD41548.1 6-phosphofructokinase [Sphingobacterium cellulitidis]OYD45692.1 6-phosphofructokinase [Sphingobacterium cellulitidis]WFB63780.1 6-phosphofructokinase [Sphingobacterium sp. WM]GGE10298.1 ATP-dependent 6-phosphofructokinase [Sphingobacterium soli]